MEIIGKLETIASLSFGESIALSLSDAEFYKAKKEIEEYSKNADATASFKGGTTSDREFFSVQIKGTSITVLKNRDVWTIFL